MDDGAPKSSYELAMERLRKKDAEQGIVERPLTEAQKAEIAEIRSLYEAKLAQAEVMHRSALVKVFEPDAAETVEQDYRRERDHLIGERDKKIEDIRSRA